MSSNLSQIILTSTCIFLRKIISQNRASSLKIDMQKGTATHAVVEETKAKHEKATTLGKCSGDTAFTHKEDNKSMQIEMPKIQTSAQMPGGANFAAFHPSQSGDALPPSAEALRIWAPALTGRFHRKSPK
jgi:hypothetical protein